ncbi:polymorphic toxin type 44 domain-containing protein [Pseudomonas sp. LS1212]|uniref:polymorphic toxin type 44 domain-containing protein n=1 Tax=Pseudomonas sp. LS1212 TaxID=2972478 RepID=UPI00215CC4BB|nr:polymorphic toxin type 44 domain-containing protein [Pseudomonas sp. LS1212]UVJ42885.1 polymorphic toxin type 44 domain-containing protein [Pseudomonas sp. LS1212]
MSRGAVNGIGQGLHGDLTTTGAVCLSSLPNAAHGGRGVLRLGDKTTPCKKCGKAGVIVDSLPAMKWHGVPTVLHGAEVRCGCPLGRNTLIAPLERPQRPSARANTASNQSAAPQPSNAAAQSVNAPAASATTKAQAAHPKFSEQTTTPSFANPSACNHPDQMEALASYIAGEMNRNIKHPAVLKMKELINYDSRAQAKKFLERPWYARLAGQPNFNAIALAKKLEAMAIWTKQVGQNMEWDHKPKLEAMYNGVVWHKQGKYVYFYDIWSNIHYGYVGIAGGLSESMLLDGAGAEQIASDTVRKLEELLKKPEEKRERPGPRPTASPWTELRSWDDVADRVSISIGVKLYKQHPNGGITAKMIMDEVLAVAPENWGDGVRVHVCK